MAAKIISRFTQLPLTLYRIQPRLQVNLRDHAVQMAKGRTSFDLKLHNGLVLPAKGEDWVGPNGMSLRPASDRMVSVLKGFKGEPRVYALLQGLQLPDGLCVIHEHTDHYSLQTTEPISLTELNDKMTKLLASVPSQTREQFLEQLEDEDDQDN